MRCSNSGHDYDAADVQWTCAASLPPEFKLGATDVVCEGHADADDEYVLKGSCAVEYRLLLTDLGQQKYGRAWKQLPRAFTTPDNLTASIAQAGFWILFCIVLFIIVRNWWRAAARPPRPTAGPGGAGGNDGDDGDGDDPPPPYDWQTPRKPQSDPRHQGQRWTPGFWSGALGGAAAAYLAGNRQSRQNSSPANAGPVWQRGESSNSNSPRPSSARYESTGFGSTRRR